MNARKEDLRAKYKKIRLGIGPRIVEDDSLIICRKVFIEVDRNDVKKICAYRPMPELKEVDINPLIEAINYKYPGIKVRILGQVKNLRIPKKKFDLILVPCLAFDKENYRLGWGGGFYDKFLATQPQAIKIGVCFQNGFVNHGLPHEPHDIPLDKIITEV